MQAGSEDPHLENHVLASPREELDRPKTLIRMHDTCSSIAALRVSYPDAFDLFQSHNIHTTSSTSPEHNSALSKLQGR